MENVFVTKSELPHINSDSFATNKSVRARRSAKHALVYYSDNLREEVITGMREKAEL